MNTLRTAAILGTLVTAFTTVAPQAAVVYRQPQTVEHNDNNCADQMGHMRSVSAAEIGAILGGHIVLMPVCEDASVPGRNVYGSLFIDGNAEKLRMPIARNAALMAALGAHDYDQNDVVSIRFGGGNSVILYVHQRDMN